MRKKSVLVSDSSISHKHQVSVALFFISLMYSLIRVLGKHCSLEQRRAGRHADRNGLGARGCRRRRRTKRRVMERTSGWLIPSGSLSDVMPAQSVIGSSPRPPPSPQTWSVPELWLSDVHHSEKKKKDLLRSLIMSWGWRRPEHGGDFCVSACLETSFIITWCHLTCSYKSEDYWEHILRCGESARILPSRKDEKFKACFCRDFFSPPLTWTLENKPRIF